MGCTRIADMNSGWGAPLHSLECYYLYSTLPVNMGLDGYHHRQSCSFCLLFESMVGILQVVFWLFQQFCCFNWVVPVGDVVYVGSYIIFNGSHHGLEEQADSTITEQL